MRILYFSREYTSHDRRFLESLSGTEHEVFYLRLEEPSGLETRPLPDRIHPLQWEGGFREESARVQRLRELIEDVHPDVVHAGPVQSCAYLAAKAGAPALATMSWGSDMLMDARAGEGRRKASFALENSAVFLCDCEAVRKEARALGMPADRIVVFPWGVDLDHFSPGDGLAVRRSLGWDDAFVVLSSRSFEPIYGVDTLVKGWMQAARNNPRLRLLLLGKGTGEAELRAMLENADLIDRVHFAGQVNFNALPGYLCAADVYVSASHSDGSSISLLEAMACGLPALVSDIPGNREWVRPEETGWRFPDGSEAALAEGLQKAASLGAELDQMGRRSREVAQERADWRLNFQRLLSGYELARAGKTGANT